MRKGIICMNSNTCLICGKVIDNKRTYCSKHCQIVAQHRNGCHTSPFKRPEVRKKAKQTIKAKYGVDNVFFIKEIRDRGQTPEKIQQQKTNRKNTLLSKYGVEYNSQIPEVKEKISKKLHNKDADNKRKTAFQKKYGVDNFFQSDTFKQQRETWVETNKQKELITKIKNNSFNKSSQEEKIYTLLCNKFNTIKRQHKTAAYPYRCDFYIEDIELYIEFQGHWTHGCAPYNKNNKKHQQILEKWEEKKDNKFYKIAINVWTEIDPIKRKTAKNNNLNWIEFFTLDDFMKWYNKN